MTGMPYHPNVQRHDTMDIPTIDTPRLTLDAPRDTDFEGYASIVTTDRGRWVGGPFTRKDAWLDFSQMVAGWVFRGYGNLSIRPKGTAAYLGTVLLHHEYGDPEPELGWLLVREAEGHGYAFEAGAAMRDWAFAHAGLRTFVSYIAPGNDRSIALALRLGGRLVDGPEGLVTYRYGPDPDDAGGG
jgi:RimJ/RimL family protein N-acetyltransferase